MKRILLIYVLSVFFITLISTYDMAATGVSCEPCSTGTVTTGLYNDTFNGCPFQIEYKYRSASCNDSWEIEITKVYVNDSCLTEKSMNVLIASLLMKIMNGGVPGFPAPPSGGQTRVKLLKKACWQKNALPPSPPGGPHGGGGSSGFTHIITPCTSTLYCCSYYLFNDSTTCTQNFVNYLPQPPVTQQCVSPCFYNCNENVFDF